MDGSGLVYEGRGDTGAAAYNRSGLQYGQTPLDNIAQNIERQNLIKQQQEFQLAKQKEKERAAAFKDLGDINLSKWDIANKQELGGDILMAKNAMAELANSGVMPNDYTNPKSQKYNEIQLGIKNKIIEADAQKAKLDEAQKLLQADFDNPNPVFDREASIAAMKAYADAPNISARRAIDPSTLLVRKEVPFDTYAPLKDFSITPFVAEKGYETEEMKSTGNYLDAPKLKEKIKSMVDNPLNEEHYQKGVAKGLWDSKSEYEKVLFDQAKLDYAKKSFYERKAPKQKTLIDISNGNTSDLLASINAGTSPANIPINNSSMMVDELNPDGTKTGNKVKAVTNVNIPNTVNLGNFNATIPMGSAMSTATGKRLKGTGALNITSGVVGTPLVYKSDNRVVPLTSGKIVYKDNEGKYQTIEGDEATLTQALLDAGIAEYKPMVLGIANTPDPNDPTKKISEAVWVDADAIIPSTKESKVLTEAQSAALILKKAAKELNSVGITPPKVNNKQIKKSDIATKAQAAGYTVDEYTKLLKSKNIEIVD